jgi:hypothetical protein
VYDLGVRPNHTQWYFSSIAGFAFYEEKPAMEIGKYLSAVGLRMVIAFAAIALHQQPSAVIT